jgi:hypothetical protein
MSSINSSGGERTLMEKVDPSEAMTHGVRSKKLNRVLVFPF